MTVQEQDVAARLRTLVRDIPDFPREGIVFKDITTLLSDALALRDAVIAMAAPYREAGIGIVAGIESRGFILGGAIARELGAGFVPVRKEGKLPASRISAEYELEYGRSIVELHVDAVGRGDRVLIVDDLLATGGTAGAAASLVERLGGVIVGVAFLIELTALGGRAALGGRPVSTVLAM